MWPCGPEGCRPRSVKMEEEPLYACPPLSASSRRLRHLRAPARRCQLAPFPNDGFPPQAAQPARSRLVPLPYGGAPAKRHRRGHLPRGSLPPRAELALRRLHIWLCLSMHWYSSSGAQARGQPFPYRGVELLGVLTELERWQTAQPEDDGLLLVSFTSVLYVGSHAIRLKRAAVCAVQAVEEHLFQPIRHGDWQPK